MIRATNNALERLILEFTFFNIKSAQFSTVASQFKYSPFDDLEEILVMRDATNRTIFCPYEAKTFYELTPGADATGRPDKYIKLYVNQHGFQEFGLYNIPNGIFTIDVMYRAFLPVYTGILDYSVGLASFTSGSATVTGSGGTVWTSSMIGRYIQNNFSQKWYRISGFTNGTTITISTPYKGSNTGAQAYSISEKVLANGQDSVIDTFIVLKAKQIYLENNLLNPNAIILIKRELEDDVMRYKAKLMKQLDNIYWLQPNNGRPLRQRRSEIFSDPYWYR